MLDQSGYFELQWLTSAKLPVKFPLIKRLRVWSFPQSSLQSIKFPRAENDPHKTLSNFIPWYLCVSPYDPHFPFVAAKSGTPDIPAQTHHFVRLSGQTCALSTLITKVDGFTPAIRAPDICGVYAWPARCFFKKGFIKYTITFRGIS